MLFDQIAKNKRKTVMLFFGFFLFMGVSELHWELS